MAKNVSSEVIADSENTSVLSSPSSAESPPEKILVAENLQVGYSVSGGLIPVLHGLGFSTCAGEIVGILGHNGMGKTTLLRTLMGYLQVSVGSYLLGGMDVTNTPPHTRAQMGVAYVPQGRGIIGTITARENLQLAHHPWCEESKEDAIERVLRIFPRIHGWEDRQGGVLSGGEQQLLSVARGLVSDPWLMLLDEPTEGIQPSIIQEMAITLRGLRDSTGLSILAVEQNLDFLLDCCDRILVMEKGRIINEMSGAELKNPSTLAAFLDMGSARLTRGEHREGSPLPSSSHAVSRSSSSSVSSSSSPSLSGKPPHPPLDQSLAVSYSDSTPHFKGNHSMPVKRPTLQQMRDLVSGLHMSMSDQDIQEYMGLMEGTFQAYDRVDALPDYLPTVKYPRTPGYRPSGEENRLNAWYIKTEIRGAASGPLSGKAVVLKDNICLAGVPMMNGSSTLEGYVPDIDATVVSRILDAGGTILGKAHCEYFCLSGGSHTNAKGPVHNPYRMGYIAGGSSSGCGALVGAGEVAMAIGGDQGGSIRIPAAFSGAYGMKPTHGLVPYTGIMPIEATIDHAGPITSSVADNALLLEVIAGADGLDPRQYAPRVDQYTAALGRGVQGLRIGVVKEGFGLPNSEKGVDAKVRRVAERLAKLGAVVEEISLPEHLDGTAIWTPIAMEGLQAQMMNGNGMGFNWGGLYTTSLLDRHANWRSRANELSSSLKISMFIGEYFIKHYGGRYYAKAQNLARMLRKAYDVQLATRDLLLMPTLPITAQPIPSADASISEIIQRAFEMVSNTAPFDATGHPAMSVPCGLVDGLPVGVMLIGRHWGERVIYQAAHALEQSGDWKTW